MKFEFGFSKQQKVDDELSGSGNSVIESGGRKKRDEEFLMSRDALDKAIKNNPEIIKKIDEKISNILGGYKISIFDELKKHKEDDNWQIGSIFAEEVKKIRESNIDPNLKVIDAPEVVLSSLLKVLTPEMRRLAYVQRANWSVLNASMVMLMRGVDSKVVYHVSPYEISRKIGGKDQEIYFSTDIKNLFDLKEGKYIYAFRLDKKTLDGARYDGAPSCFGKRALKEGIEIEDSITIYDPLKPGYRAQVMDEIGAKFNSDYKAANRGGDKYLSNDNTPTLDY